MLGLTSALSILYVVMPDPLPVGVDDVGMGLVALVTGVLSGTAALITVVVGSSVRFGRDGRPAMAGANMGDPELMEPRWT